MLVTPYQFMSYNALLDHYDQSRRDYEKKFQQLHEKHGFITGAMMDKDSAELRRMFECLTDKARRCRERGELGDSVADGRYNLHLEEGNVMEEAFCG